jgi:hypothetical protein
MCYFKEFSYNNSKFSYVISKMLLNSFNAYDILLKVRKYAHYPIRKMVPKKVFYGYDGSGGKT